MRPYVPHGTKKTGNRIRLFIVEASSDVVSGSLSKYESYEKSSDPGCGGGLLRRFEDTL